MAMPPPLPYMDISPEQFASRLLYLAACIRPSCSIRELATFIQCPKKRYRDLWARSSCLQCDDITLRVNGWMGWAETLVDLLFTHTLIDFTALNTGRFPSGVSYENMEDFKPSYLWLRPEDVWRFLCELMTVPPERWLLKESSAGEIEILEAAVKRWGQAFLYPKHDTPDVAAHYVPECNVKASVELPPAVYQLEQSLRDLFAWLDIWQKAPYNTFDLLRHVGKLAEVYYRVYDSLICILVRRRRINRLTVSASLVPVSDTKVASRLVYLMIGNELENATSLDDISTSPRFRTALQQAHRFLRLIHRLAGWEQLSEREHALAVFLADICNFWTWHAEEVLRRVLVYSWDDFEDYVPLPIQMLLELERRVKKYLIIKGAIKQQRVSATSRHQVQRSGETPYRREDLPIYQWLNELASLPYNVGDLMGAVSELHKYVWARHSILTQQWLQNATSCLQH